MSRVRLIHWNKAEGAERVKLLKRAGFTVEYNAQFDSRIMRQCRENPPAVFLIDLSRLPSQGREAAIGLRQSPKTRHVPIVFCDGVAEKVKQISAILPDAVCCTSETLVKALREAKPVSAPVRPADMMNRYGSRTTAQKLGIKEGSAITVVHPPGNFRSVLGELPGGAEFVEEAGAVTICFVHSVSAVREEMSRLRQEAAKTKLWIAWRKKSAPVTDGVTEDLVRTTGIALGLVDYKVCGIDDTWSGMLFARSKAR
jgi:CheY-like chemotaxis protein